VSPHAPRTLPRLLVGLRVLAVVALFFLAACSGGGPAASGESRELIIARDMDLSTLDPARAYCDTCQIYLTAAYQTVIGVDPQDVTGKVARLATSWSASPDNREFTFQLDPAARFADGTPVEAKDVKWSWDRMARLQGSASYLMAGYEEITAPDPQTVVVTFAEPNSAFLDIVTAPYMGIVNSDVAAEHGASAEADAVTADTSENWFLQNSAGSGPFVLTSYTPNEELVLSRNDAFWQQGSPFPAVRIKQVEDATSQLQQLQQGDVDIAMQISLDSVDQLRSAPDVTVEMVDSYNFVYLALSPGATGPGAAELSDPRVRRAIKLAIDYRGMLDTTVRGFGKPQAAPIPNGFAGSDGFPAPAQDLAQASALMAEAGLSDGFAVRAVYPQVNIYGVDFNVMMQKVEQDLAEINVDLDLQPVEFTQWSTIVSGEGIPFTAVYFAPDHTSSSQYIQYFGQVQDSAWAERGAGSGRPPLIDPAETALLQQALAASGDAAADLYHQLGQHMIDDTMILPLVNPQLVLAHSSDISGMHYSACCNLELGNLGLQP
jgi:peptide/nickel transport system substrate-binding protein